MYMQNNADIADTPKQANIIPKTRNIPFKTDKTIDNTIIKVTEYLYFPLNLLKS